MSEYPEVIVGAYIFNKDGKILLVESEKFPGLLNVPSGHIEIGETIEQAVKREVKEEVGLDVIFERIIKVNESIFSKELNPPNKHYIFLECICFTDSDTFKIDEKEIKKAVWINPKEAINLKLEKYARITIEKYLGEK
ncbi:MAG: NUDIX domain-containing protein [Candidatus Aenigmarchaeota archaeon]|nr:NUDIX domain-containing protein [Candidatus Aenigmarchaeota archaeon]